jgi:2-polyprenyl-3-methyl-5-hydroxy-6-metoxy-1,4-benzoquinol methylase
MPIEPRDPGGTHVESSYDGDPQREWARMDRHRTEYAVTMHALNQYLPSKRSGDPELRGTSAPARVLDCGGGPGRFAIALSELGYEVTLFDLSAGNLRLAREKAAQTGVHVARYEHGTATDLSRFPDESFDAVLLMGPLYHLLDRENRLRALREAGRVLVPGGPLFAAFITPYASLRYAAARDLSWPRKEPDAFRSVLEHGLLPPRGEPGSAFVATFAHPQEVPPLLQEAGFELTALLGVEGLVSMIEDGINQLQGEDWQAWVDLNVRVAPDPSIHGGVEHLLAVAFKPRWRAVLHRIARSLAEARIAFKVVGGTAAVLHGVPIPVHDIDLELDTAGAYRFQELFADHAIRPVAFSASEVYRSHFGRFAFQGMPVEVMGDLHRREQEGWVPSATLTETTVALDGVPIPTSWLEEEVLAYIRRGRLERAAQCLPHCNHGRLLALFRREQPTDVL